jgi:hypothetical protein
MIADRFVPFNKEAKGVAFEARVLNLCMSCHTLPPVVMDCHARLTKAYCLRCKNKILHKMGRRENYES